MKQQLSVLAIALLLAQLFAVRTYAEDSRSKPYVNIAYDDYTLPGTNLLDVGRFEQLMEELNRQIYKPPVNAYIGDSGQIVPGKIGSKLDREKFAESFLNSLYGNRDEEIELPQAAVYPRIDSELLSEIREKLIGHYVTYYNASNKNRAHNIALAAKSINNTVVFPGELFSFNRVVGQRTAERGYLRASIIVKGEFSEGIGGGICQVSSTLYNATDKAGLKIVQRYSHSRSVPYVPPGRDATVSWGGPDFAFKNQYNQPILIRAYAMHGKMQVSLYSSDSINYKPREVPNAGEIIPEEITVETGSGVP